MGWPVILTEQSQDDLREIVVFIARDDPQAARRFGNQLIDQALAIGNFPEIGRMVPELGDSSVREIVHGAIASSTNWCTIPPPSSSCGFGTQHGESRRSPVAKPEIRAPSSLVWNAMEYIAPDEYVEATPKSLRLRKKILDATARKRAGKN